MTSSPQKLIDDFLCFREQHFELNDGLCDSRVDPALMLDCAPEDLFVIRNVANLVPPAEGLRYNSGWIG